MDTDTLPTWRTVLGEEYQKPYMHELRAFVAKERAAHTVYPHDAACYRALTACPLANTRVVILGQDPYHGAHAGTPQADGLAFSVPLGVPLPPSLANIFQELRTDTGIHNTSGDLSAWAAQGVLLLNSVLSVRAHEAASHSGKGWEAFTDAVIAAVNGCTHNAVFVFWGNYAKQKGRLVDSTRHGVITSAHPSPLAAHRGFFGSRPFSRINDYLARHGYAPMDWRTESTERA